MKRQEVQLGVEYAVNPNERWGQPARILILEEMARAVGTRTERGFKGRILDGGARSYNPDAFGLRFTIGLRGVKRGGWDDDASQQVNTEGFVKARHCRQTWEEHLEREAYKAAIRERRENEDEAAEADLAELQRRVDALGIKVELRHGHSYGDVPRTVEFTRVALQELIELAEQTVAGGTGVGRGGANYG